MAPDKKTIYLFFGDDNFSSNQKVNQWREEFEKKYGDINIELLNGRELVADDLAVSLSAMPFLGEKRLVIIYDFLGEGNTEEQKKVTNILEKITDTCICVFVENTQPDQRTSLFKKINKLGIVKDFKCLSEPELAAWIISKAKEKDLKISTKLAIYMASLTGPNLWNLENEIDKLSLYCKGRETQEKDIDELVKPTLTSSIFKLTDYLSERNKKKSLETLTILRGSGEEPLKIMFMIARHFRILLEVKDLINKRHGKSQIITQIKEHPYVLNIAMSQCGNFDMEKLKKIYKDIHTLDVAVKTGKISSSGDSKQEFILAIEKFIIESCR